MFSVASKFPEIAIYCVTCPFFATKNRRQTMEDKGEKRKRKEENSQTKDPITPKKNKKAKKNKKKKAKKKVERAVAVVAKKKKVEKRTCNQFFGSWMTTVKYVGPWQELKDSVYAPFYCHGCLIKKQCEYDWDNHSDLRASIRTKLAEKKQLTPKEALVPMCTFDEQQKQVCKLPPGMVLLTSNLIDLCSRCSPEVLPEYQT
jgi:hypothetical protein